MSSVSPVPKAAVLLVDVQQSFEHTPYWSPVDTPRFFERTQTLLDGARECGIPVVQIFHVEDSGPFSMGSGHVKTLSGVSVTPQATFHKPRHSAFVACALPVWLAEHGIRRLIVAGIRTEQCCETTTRHAADCGYAVDFVSEATLTFAMTDSAGRRFSAQDIKTRTELVLERRFARIFSVEQALAPTGEALS
jgi:nicotinamidase-related amidase